MNNAQGSCLVCLYAYYKIQPQNPQPDVAYFQVGNETPLHHQDHTAFSDFSDFVGFSWRSMAS